MNNAIQDDTRQRLIMAGLAAFNDQGFEAASTRCITSAAGANVASIAYHFGNKEKLYLAVAEYIADQIGVMVDRFESKLGDKLPLIRSGKLPQSEAVAVILDLCDKWLKKLFISRRHNQAWSSFIFHEQSNPTAAFDILYEKGIGRFLEIFADLFACVEKRSPKDFGVRFRAFTLFGQMLSFEREQATMQKYFNWKKMDQAALGALNGMIRIYIKRLAGNAGR
jgi:AcrR family transcriptional regulator